MSKTVQSLLGMFLFFFVFMNVLGIWFGYSEQQAYVEARSEIIQIVREAELPNGMLPVVGKDYVSPVGERVEDNHESYGSKELDNYVDKFKGKLGDARVRISVLEPSDGEVNFGDTLVIEVDAMGSGTFGFVRRGDDEFSNMHLKSAREIQVQNRRALN